MLLFASRCWFNHQCRVKSTVNCKKFSKSQKISTERLLLFLIVHWTLLQQFQKCTSGMCVLQRLTFEVFTWALVLQITVPHWQSHLWLASCETLLWLPALEEGTLVYIWPPRLLSTTSGRAGREGRAQVFAHKRNPWPWLRAPRHPCPRSSRPISLLSPPPTTANHPETAPLPS